MPRSRGSNCDHNWVSGFCRNCGGAKPVEGHPKQERRERKWVPNRGAAYYKGEIKVNIMTSSGSSRARMVLEELDSRGMLEAEEGPIADIRDSLINETGQMRAMRMVINPVETDGTREIDLYSVHHYTDVETGEAKETVKKMPPKFYSLMVNTEGRISGHDGIQLISERLLRLKARKVFEADTKKADEEGAQRLRGYVSVHGQVTQLIRLALHQGRFAQGGTIDMSPEKQGVFYNCFGPDMVEIPDPDDGFYPWRCPPPLRKGWHGQGNAEGNK